jgi:hypothetical protein
MPRREPATAGHWDRGAILAGAAVSSPGPQRIIAQMLRAYVIQTNISQHHVVPVVLKYESTRNLLWQMDYVTFSTCNLQYSSAPKSERERRTFRCAVRVLNANGAAVAERRATHV